jgi:hypothetical protein
MIKLKLINNMETIFDYNPTPAELKRAGIQEYGEDDGEDAPTIEEQIAFKKQLFEESPDDANYRLGMLFAGRGDMKKANEYWAKIKNKRILDTLIEDF